MSRAALMAGVAGACAVLAAWEALGAVESGLAARARGLLAPLARAGTEGRTPTTVERRRLAVLGAATLGAAGWLIAGPPAALAAGAGGPWLAVSLVRARRRRYQHDLARGAPLLARALADALAGGHSVRGALREAGRGVSGAAGAELRAVVAALTLGEATDAALERLRRRTAGGPAARPFDTIVAAIMLQRRAGGDLARLLRTIADALEDAARLDEDARTATAQARFTALIVCGLPVGAAALAELASPGYTENLLRSPLTAWLGGCAIALQLGALAAIRRLSRVTR